MKKLQKLLRGVLVVIIKGIWHIPGLPVTLLVVLIFGFTIPIPKHGFLDFRFYHHVTIISIVFIPSLIFFVEFLFFTSVALLLSAILGVLGWITGLNFLEKAADNLLNSKIMEAFIFGDPTYMLIKFVLSLFIGRIISMSPFLIFSLSPYYDRTISEKIKEKIENSLIYDAKNFQWSWLKYDLIKAMTNERLPKGRDPKWYAKK